VRYYYVIVWWVGADVFLSLSRAGLASAADGLRQDIVRLGKSAEASRGNASPEGDTEDLPVEGDEPGPSEGDVTLVDTSGDVSLEIIQTPHQNMSPRKVTSPVKGNGNLSEDAEQVEEDITMDEKKEGEADGEDVDSIFGSEGEGDGKKEDEKEDSGVSPMLVDDKGLPGKKVKMRDKAGAPSRTDISPDLGYLFTVSFHI
jgi:hypothetical protein